MTTTLSNDSLLRDVPDHLGCKVLDPCVLYDRLGEGGMGAVYRGCHLNLGIEVAVKVMKDLGGDGQSVARFQREATTAASINHAGLIRVFDVRSAHGLYYLVMELVRGETLRQRVRRKGPLSPAEACTLVRAAAEGVGAAHAAGIIHRDLKPDNVLVAADGTVKVLDLGLAKGTGIGCTLLTETRRLMGTPAYMAPEQFDGAEHASARSDVLALGATLAFLLLGRDPHGGSSVTAVMKAICLGTFPDVARERQDVPCALLDVLQAAVHQDPAARPADALTLAERLRECERDLGSADLADPAAVQPAGDQAPPGKTVLAAIRDALAETVRTRLDDVPPTLTGNAPAARRTRSGRPVVAALLGLLLAGGAGGGAWLTRDVHPTLPEVAVEGSGDPAVPPAREAQVYAPAVAAAPPLVRARDALARHDPDGVLAAFVEAAREPIAAADVVGWDDVLAGLREDGAPPAAAIPLVAGRETAWRTLAAAGSAVARLTLAESAMIYGLDDVIELDPARADDAVRLLVAAANTGNARAWFYLGDVSCQIRRLLNPRLAVASYARARDLGCADGLARIGQRHLYEVQNLHPELADDERRRRGREYVRLAASARSARGMYWYGVCLHDGLGGPKDVPQAWSWLEQAAARGHARAIEACRARD